MEDRWLSLVDLWQTYDLPTPARSSSPLIAVCILSWLKQEHPWYGVDQHLHTLQGTHFIF